MAGPHVCRLIPCVPGGCVCVLACPSMVMLIITLSHLAAGFAGCAETSVVGTRPVQHQ